MARQIFEDYRAKTIEAMKKNKQLKADDVRSLLNDTSNDKDASKDYIEHRERLKTDEEFLTFFKIEAKNFSLEDTLPDISQYNLQAHWDSQRIKNSQIMSYVWATWQNTLVFGVGMGGNEIESRMKAWFQLVTSLPERIKNQADRCL